MPIFGWGRNEKMSVVSRVSSLMIFAIIAVISTLLLFGSLFHEKKFGVPEMKELMHTAVSDTYCAGSNLYVYFCMIFVPNMLFII